MKSSEACIALCLKSNPNCKAVEWWENDGQDCFECTRPSLKTKFTDTTDGGYSPHVLVKPEKLAGELKSFAGKVLEVKIGLIVSCESTAQEVSFEWSHHRISSTDSKVRTTY